MKIYLASPLFSIEERENVTKVANILRTQGHEVYVPMEHSIENAWDYANSKWGKMVFDEDVKAIRDCDLVVGLYYGLYSDSGTAWEFGFAYGIGKQTLILTDYIEDTEVSLMVANSCINNNDFIKFEQT